MAWHLSPEQRHEIALKSAATRKRDGIKPFGGKHGTHKGGFHLTPAQRVAAARKAAATRRARGER